MNTQEDAAKRLDLEIQNEILSTPVKVDEDGEFIMTIKVRLVIMSHLSDLQIETGFGQKEMQSMVSMRLNFIKWLVIHFPNTDVEIDPDAEYQKFLDWKNGRFQQTVSRIFSGC